MRRQPVIVLVVFVFLLGSAEGGLADLTSASFQGLGDTAGGGGMSEAYGVSADGLVVVGMSTASLGRQAFRWTESTGMVGLGSLPGQSFQESQARGASADGSAVVGWVVIASGQSRAFRWTQGTGMVGLSDPGGSGFPSVANGVSADGSVVVGRSYPASVSEAFRWTENTGMVGLGTLPGTSKSEAYGVSADGSVVVGSSSEASRAEAFRWTESTGMVGLGGLPGRAFSSALAVSGDGSVVVGSAFAPENNAAFRWTETGGMARIGLSNWGEPSYASAASNDGSVVVGKQTQAFIWWESYGMPLRDLLTVQYGLDLTGWDLITARGVSADGLTIVGDGRNPENQAEAWMARIPSMSPPQVVPVPGAALLGAIGLSFAGWRLKQRTT